MRVTMLVRCLAMMRGGGETRHLALDAEFGRLFVTTSGEVALIVLADPDAAAGLLRVAMQRAMKAVA